MKQYQSISVLKDHAKGKLTGKFGTAALLTFLNSTIHYTIYIGISQLISAIVIAINLPETGDITTYAMTYQTPVGISVLQYVLTLLGSIILGVFNTGISLFFLNQASGRTANMSDLFYGFNHMFKKSLVLSAATTLLGNICLLPFDIFSFLYTEDEKWLIYLLISAVFGIITYIPVTLSISQTYFLLLDFPTRSAKELLGLSIRIMKGKKRKLFLIQLSFLPLQFLGLLSFGIGNLWITPYMNMTKTLFFLDIMKPETTAESPDCPKNS